MHIECLIPGWMKEVMQHYQLTHMCSRTHLPSLLLPPVILNNNQVTTTPGIIIFILVYNSNNVYLMILILSYLIYLCKLRVHGPPGIKMIGHLVLGPMIS